MTSNIMSDGNMTASWQYQWCCIMTSSWQLCHDCWHDEGIFNSTSSHFMWQPAAADVPLWHCLAFSVLLVTTNTPLHSQYTVNCTLHCNNRSCTALHTAQCSALHNTTCIQCTVQFMAHNICNSTSQQTCRKKQISMGSGFRGGRIG